MSSFALAFETVCPLLLLLALGYALRRIGLFDGAFLDRLNMVCFQVFLPTILFVNVYDSDLSTALQPNLIVFAVLSILVTFTVLTIAVLPLEKQQDRRAVLVQGGFRSNFILFGLPIATSVFGPEHTGPTAMLIAFIIPLFNVLAVVAFELFRGGRVNLRSLVHGVITNPLLIAAALAWVFVLLGIKLPNVLETAIGDVAQVATPLALIALGGTFSFHSLWPNRSPLLLALGCKLIILPAIGLAIAIAVGFRGPELGALLALFASPAAVSSFTMAQSMGGDGELAGQIVALGSTCSLVTLFCAILILANLGVLAT